MVTCISLMYVSGYKQKFQGFIEDFKYLMSINRERMTINKSAPEKMVINSPFYSLSLLIKRFEEDI